MYKIICKCALVCITFTNTCGLNNDPENLSHCVLVKAKVCSFQKNPYIGTKKFNLTENSLSVFYNPNNVLVF